MDAEHIQIARKLANSVARRVAKDLGVVELPYETAENLKDDVYCAVVSAIEATVDPDN